jgi:Ca2+-binding EF-hand superfamily protein
MYDIDRSGFLSIDEIEALMMGSNLKTRDMIKKRAATLMASADTDQSGDVCIGELLAAAERFPNLLFPNHARRKQ